MHFHFRDFGKLTSDEKEIKTPRHNILILTLSRSIQAALTENQRLSSLNSKWFTVWEAGCSRSWHQQICCVVRACFLCKDCLLAMSSHDRRSKGALWDLCCKGTNECSTLMT